MIAYTDTLADSVKNNYHSWITRAEEQGTGTVPNSFLSHSVPAKKHNEVESTEVSHVESAGYSV